ncbi:MAG: DsrE family protein [Methanoregula sp.]|uniref:DsrE family protein n=1 Tax=Methanoregula sp. TaxID=2052170 RepID=UPI003BAE2663
MTAIVLLFSTVLTQERLSWLDQALRYHYQQTSGEPSGTPGVGTPACATIFLTGDALYSLNEAESLNIWSSVLSLQQVRLICDRDALEHRGITLVPLKERFPDQVTDLPDEGKKGAPSFWAAVLSAARDQFPPTPLGIGWLQISSPYMFPAAGYGLLCLSAALDLHCGVSLYAYLDGCHACHTGQNPGDAENIGDALERLAKRAAEKNLPCTVMVSRYSAGARGYQSWDDGMGTIGSSCIVRPAHIKDMDVMIRHIGNLPVLLSENAGIVHGAHSRDPVHDAPHPPAVIVLITHSPYSTGHAYGGIALAVACAHQGIRTQVIFLEDGIYTLTGEHRAPEGSCSGPLPELVTHLSKSKNLEFSALSPSFHTRGVTKNGTLAAVKEIGFPELGTILFSPPRDAGSGLRRILFF